MTIIIIKNKETYDQLKFSLLACSIAFALNASTAYAAQPTNQPTNQPK